MLLAILVVLILIAVLIAPWLIALAAAAAAIYGIYLVAAAAVAGLCLIIAVTWVLITGTGRREEKPEQLHGERKACKYCQVEMAVSAIYCKNCGKSTA